MRVFGEFCWCLILGCWFAVFAVLVAVIAWVVWLLWLVALFWLFVYRFGLVLLFCGLVGCLTGDLLIKLFYLGLFIVGCVMRFFCVDCCASFAFVGVGVCCWFAMVDLI